jgi:hypothetical protein
MAISGVLNNNRYYLWWLKEPSYVMKIMAKRRVTDFK